MALGCAKLSYGVGAGVDVGCRSTKVGVVLEIGVVLGVGSFDVAVGVRDGGCGVSVS